MAATNADHVFEKVKEEELWKRFVCVKNRYVKFPDGKVHEFDIVYSKSNHFVVVLPFFSKTKTFTVIREFTQGSCQLGWSLACGRFDEKHGTVEDAARAELNEEAGFKGGRLISLLPPGHPGVLENKWSEIRFTPFVCIDPEVDETPAARDEEEFIEVRNDVGLEQLEELLYSGDMHVPSALCGLQALRYLRKEKHID